MMLVQAITEWLFVREMSGKIRDRSDQFVCISICIKSIDSKALTN